MQTTVISLGGSLICPNDVDVLFLKNFVKLIKSQKNKKIIIITGGGSFCRKYNSAFDAATTSKNKNKNNNVSKDLIGISMTKVNATLIQQLLINANLKVKTDLIQNPAQKINWKNNSIAIGAGYLPGHSTDYDAVLAAIANKAQTVINLTNMDYVYTSDPKKNKNAKPLKNLTWQEYKKVLNVKEWTAGLHTPFDPLASKLATAKKLTIFIVNGTKIKSINSIFSKEVIGTKIS